MCLVGLVLPPSGLVQDRGSASVIVASCNLLPTPVETKMVPSTGAIWVKWGWNLVILLVRRNGFVVPGIWNGFGSVGDPPLWNTLAHPTRGGVSVVQKGVPAERSS